MQRLTMAMVSSLLLVAPVSAQEWAKARLEKSPRHQEWVKVKQGEREVNCFVVFPEVKDKAPVVLLIHEIFGLDQLPQTKRLLVGYGHRV